MKSSPIFPHHPAWWQSCISFPDEPDKVLVGREGGLLLDYERDGRGWRHFRTVIEPGPGNVGKFVGQSLQSPRVPIVTTVFDSDGVEMTSDIFACAPDAQEKIPPALRREGGEEKITGWDGPKFPRVRRDFVDTDDCAPEFRDAAWASGGQTICYQLLTNPGGLVHVVVGLAEGEHKEPGQRILDIDVDGCTTRKVDAAATFGFQQPGLVRFAARDTGGDGIIRIRIQAADDSPDRNAFASAIWVFPSGEIADDAILRGEAAPVAFADCGREVLPRRRHLMRLRWKNNTSTTQTRAPFLRVWTLERAALREGALEVGHATRVLAGDGFRDLERDGDALLAELTPVVVPPHGSVETFVSVSRHGHESPAPDRADFAAARESAEARWVSLPLPYEVITVPDARLQALIDSSVRNIYQARDIQNGQPAFHVGPTCYRQLWIVDGAFLLETAALLGRADEARAGLAYILGFQEDDGGFQLKARYWKETGIVLWTVTRHAMLTADREWLRSAWPQVVLAVEFIMALRDRDDAGDAASPVHHLAPYGDIDGGISNMGEEEKLPEFSNTYWLLTGLKAAAEAADWLGENASARAWDAEFRDLLATFQKAARTHRRSDSHGNKYLPIRLGADDSPQKGQWAFCHAVHPGAVFEPEDEFVRGMLAMLDATKIEGLVYDTGWMPHGLWTYFASFMGHARLWQGDAVGAVADLEAMADHASPMLVWREEQKPAGCGDEEVGDMPHNWASAEFIRLAFHLIAMERSNELHLFHGIPSRWLRGGGIVEVRGAMTIFGPLSASVCFRDGRIHIDVAPLSRPCDALVIHQTAWNPGSDPIRLHADKAVTLSLDASADISGDLRSQPQRTQSESSLGASL